MKRFLKGNIGLHRLFKRHFVALFPMILVFFFSSVNADQTMDRPTQELYEMSIEDLMNIRITSVSKKEQKLSDAAAAVFVITQEDIRRSGVTNIPDALRMVPGLQVSRIDANKYSITSRGFSGRWANKLLVLMDGRSIYSPIFSGVIWEMQDTLLEDIDRIEVIRGPGATLWGANAVNGIINIITKNAKDSQDTVWYSGVGTEERLFGGFRHGGKINENTFYRFYAKYFDRDNAVLFSGEDAYDDWNVFRTGFRLDIAPSDEKSYMLIGNLYNGNVHDTIMIPSVSPPYMHNQNEKNDIRGGDITVRMNHKWSNRSSMMFQINFDNAEYNSSVLNMTFGHLDFDFQHQLVVGDMHNLIWGLGYRYMYDSVDNTQTTALIPDSRSTHLFSAFLQDEITLKNDRLRLILGSKFEHNDYTEYEVQPGGRLIWTPNSAFTLWSAISRSVRTPSRGENDNRLERYALAPGEDQNPSPFPVLITAVGNPKYDSEMLLAYELGLRLQPVDALMIDITGYYNDYDMLRYTEIGPPIFRIEETPPHIEIRAHLENKMFGYTYGTEMSIDWKPIQHWRLQTSYTYLYMNLENPVSSTESEDIEKQSPANQLSIRSELDLKKKYQLDVWLRYVDELPLYDISDYMELDVRLGFHPRENIELSVVGQNLFDDMHGEFISDIVETLPSQVERSIYGKITFRY